ncbi:MAG: flagellar basal body L-ring protein FlgH [Candidatus Latescibacteria bacterium]|nr:flagellar basal body L-ring protein FlgH [bacterium]MCB9515226.1 flagellar basal body L-ring protein FlgH [Candidatus Latescibacterota bacterium]
MTMRSSVRQAGLALALLAGAAGARADALWDSNAGGSLFANVKAHQPGDLLTVLITENSSASSDAKTGTESKHDTAGGPGEGALNFIPLWGFSQKTTYDGKGNTTRKGQLSAVMSVRIVEELPGGMFRVEGHREIKRNGEIEEMSLTGIIRSRDIGPDNTINSSAIADAVIHYDGTGDVANGNEPGFLTRLINWFF